MSDYIKREDLMERVGRWQLNTREAIAEMIMSVPSADVIERKRGKWEVIAVDNLDLANGVRIYVPEFKCNQCGSYYESDVRWVEPIMPEDAHFPKFCPNCGADMRGKQDERTD